MKKRKNKLETIISILVLLLAIGLGILTRFYKLGQAPAGLYLDEAGQGYSAYSILKTGKDEFGKPFPIVFRSFTDFKTPIYIYLLVPLIPVFGLTKFTVRFPSFIFSILTIPLVYLLIKKISPKKRVGNYLGLATALLLAISPWHILFGRTNFECNVALFFFLAGIYSFYLAINPYPERTDHQGKERPAFLLLSALMFSLAIPAYHAQRLITPLMILILFLKHRKRLLSQKHKPFLIAGLIIGFLISLPTLIVALTPGFLARAGGLNIFSGQRTAAGYLENYQGIFNFLVNSRLFLSTREFLSLYLSYFSPREMFSLGDYGPRSSFPELATFFIWQLPFYLSGLYLLIKKKELGELRFFTLVFLIIAPLPAAVTRDPYSSIRALQLVIPQLIIIGLGIFFFVQWLFEKVKQPVLRLILKPILFLSIGLIVIYSLLKLYSSVIILNEHYRAEYWNYGWETVAETIKTLNQDLPIAVDNSRSEPYSQLIFFLKTDPEQFQADNPDVNLNEYYTDLNRTTTRKIGQITTRPINWETDPYQKQYLIADQLAVSDEQIQEHHLRLIRTVSYPDWSIAFRILETTPKEKCASDPQAPREFCINP